MEQSNTWHRGAPPSHRLKHDSRAIVSALVLGGDEYGIADEVDELLAIWADHLAKNQLRRRYYDGENVLKDLGISIPPSLRNIETVVGWPKKAVSAMASRSRFDGFTVGDEALAEQVDQLVRRCNLKRKYRQACESELIAGCDFVTLSKGAAGEPPVIVVTHSAEDGAAKWSERLGRISSGLVIMHYDASGAPDELALYTDEATYHVDGRDALTVERMAHRMGRPLMEALAYNPTESQPLGQSRITRAVRFITDSGVREALRTEISAEFFTSLRSTCSAWTQTPSRTARAGRPTSATSSPSPRPRMAPRRPSASSPRAPCSRTPTTCGRSRRGSAERRTSR